MINILSIYKFHFPFLELKYEQTKSRSFLSDTKEFLLYEGLFQKVETQQFSQGEMHTFHFQGGKIEMIFTNFQIFFIPVFEFHLYLDPEDIKLKERMFHMIYNITQAYGRDDYIYDVDESFLYYRQDDVISIDDLEKNFGTIKIKKIENFITQTPKDFLQEYLDANFSVKYALIYLVYVCYSFYYNARNIASQTKIIDEILQQTTQTEYQQYTYFASLRLEHTKNITHTQFKRYFEILQGFFLLFEKK